VLRQDWLAAYNYVTDKGALAAAATGLTGALIFLQTARISPDAAFALTDWTVNVIFIVVIGGIGTIEGPILGVLVFFALRSSLADYGSWYLMTLGLIAIAVMLLAPKGLWGLISARTDLHLFRSAAGWWARRSRAWNNGEYRNGRSDRGYRTGWLGDGGAARQLRRGKHGREPLSLAIQHAARPHHQSAHDGSAARPRAGGRG
jgi:Branched-chain amino acid transport system / permease component